MAKVKVELRFVKTKFPEVEDDATYVTVDGREVGHIQHSFGQFVPAYDVPDGIKFCEAKSNLGEAIMLLLRRSGDDRA